jgi:hypothetical protein
VYAISVHRVCILIDPCFSYAQENRLLVREAFESRTKQLYQLEKPVVYIMPITTRLPLIPVGDHCTIPVALRGSKRDLFPLGKRNEDLQPGTGSRLFYISS